MVQWVIGKSHRDGKMQWSSSPGKPENPAGQPKSKGPIARFLQGRVYFQVKIVTHVKFKLFFAKKQLNKTT